MLCCSNVFQRIAGELSLTCNEQCHVEAVRLHSIFVPVFYRVGKLISPTGSTKENKLTDQRRSKIQPKKIKSYKRNETNKKLKQKTMNDLAEYNQLYSI